MNTRNTLAGTTFGIFISGALALGCGSASEGTGGGGATGTGGAGGGGGGGAAQAVMEIAVREVVDVAGFDAHRAEIAALVEAQAGFVASREFVSFYSIAPDPNPKNPIWLALSQWRSLDDYQKADAALAEGPAFPAYLATIKPLAGAVVKPFLDGEAIDVANIIGPGQVLEVAMRDLSAVGDRQTFFAAKDAFVEVLTGAPGVVREYEWVSATGADDLYFGMTQYESQAAFQSVAMDPAITQGPEAAKFFTSYPPLIAQITAAAP